MSDPGHEYENQKSERTQLIHFSVKHLAAINLTGVPPEFKAGYVSTNSHTAQRTRRDIHRHAFAGSQSRLCRASVNPGVKPKNKASQSWSGLVKPKTFSEKQPDATHNTHFTSREPFLHHFFTDFCTFLETAC